MAKQKHIHCYVNIDEEGNIIESLEGFRVVPNKQYDHFFLMKKEDVVDEEGTIIDLAKKYRIENNEIIQKKI